MDITRSQLARSLSMLQTLDSSASPYIGLQWTASGVAFYRTSNLGYVRSLNYQREQRALVLSFSHMARALKAITAEQVSLEMDKTGMLRLSSTDDFGTSEVRIHTQRIETAWSKTHRPGAGAKQFSPSLFQGIDTTSYTLATPPVIKYGKLMLFTNSGVMMRSGIADSPFPYPRENFLKALHGMDVQALYQTVEGYWGVTTAEFELVIAGHRLGDSMFDIYNRLADPLGTLPAARFYAALNSAKEWGDKDHWVRLNFRAGRIETKNAQNDPGEFSFGQPTDLESLSISTGTVSNFMEMLRQGTEELIEVASFTDFIRFTKGSWELNTKVIR